MNALLGDPQHTHIKQNNTNPLTQTGPITLMLTDSPEKNTHAKLYSDNYMHQHNRNKWFPHLKFTWSNEKQEQDVWRQEMP